MLNFGDVHYNSFYKINNIKIKQLQHVITPLTRYKFCYRILEFIYKNQIFVKYFDLIKGPDEATDKLFDTYVTDIDTDIYVCLPCYKR